MHKSPNKNEQSTKATTAWMTHSQLQSLLVLVSSCLVLMAAYWVYLGGHRGQLIEIDRADPLTAKYEVDINRADWPGATKAQLVHRS
jgi:hypothetical protein